MRRSKQSCTWGSELPHVQNLFKLCQKLHFIRLIKIPRQKNPTLPLRSRYMERKTKVHMAYYRANMFITIASYRMSQLRYQFTSREHS